MQKRFIISCLALCIGSTLSFCVTKNNVNFNRNDFFDESVYHGTVNPDIKNATVNRFEGLNLSDPYFTGSSSVEYLRNRYYQNITMNYLTDGSMKNIWDNYTGKNVTVAVIDTGIDIDHEDFENAISDKSAYIYTTYSQSGTTYHVTIEKVSDSPQGMNIIKNTYIPSKAIIDSHGTNTAGVIGARNNGKGTIGVAFDCTLMVLRIDLDYYSIQAAINYAVANGADVINMSLGGYGESFIDGYGKEQTGNAAIRTFLTAQINAAYNAGVILVASAGNEKTSHKSYPACNDHVIGVGALELNNKSLTADFSNFNGANDNENTCNNVDVVTPGYVVTPEIVGTPSHPDHTYVFAAGTSFSAPVVAGAAALWKEKNPSGTAHQFTECLKSSCTDIRATGWDKQTGFGRLNIASLLEVSVPEGCNGNVWYIVFPGVAFGLCLILIALRRTKSNQN